MRQPNVGLLNQYGVKSMNTNSLRIARHHTLHKVRLFWGISILCCAFFVGTIQSAVIKIISHDLPIISIVFTQYCVCLIALAPQIIKEKSTILASQHKKLLVMRALCGVAYFFCMFTALKTSSLVDVSLMINTAPLWVPILSFIFCKKTIGPNLYLILALGFAGVLFILKPDHAIISTGSIIALLGGIFMAIGMLVLNRLTHKESPTCILFYYALTASIVLSIPAILCWKTPSESIDLWLLLANGLLMVLQQYLLIRGFRLGKASELSVTAYSGVIFAALVDYILWGHNPQTTTLIGATLIILSGWKVLTNSQPS
jgi:drug/metabolite transporter (DMT)-like permease